MKYLILSLALTAFFFVGCAGPTDPVDDEEPTEDTSILEELHVFNTVGIPHDLIVTDKYVFVAEDQAGFSIHDRLQRELKSRITQFNDTNYENIRQLGYAEAINTLFVFERFGYPAIYFWDIEDPFDPVQYASDTVNNIRSVGYFYTESDENGNTILAIAMTNSEFRFGYVSPPDDPSFPNNLNWMSEIYSMPNNINKFDFNDEYIYFAGAQRGMYVFDIDTKQVITEKNLTGDALDIAVKGDYAYIVAKQEGLLVVNIADPYNPEWVYSYDTSGWAQSVCIEGDYLAVGSGGGGAYLFDIKDNPAKPQLLDRKTSAHTDYVYFVKLSNEQLFVAGRYKGITQFNINK